MKIEGQEKQAQLKLKCKGRTKENPGSLLCFTMVKSHTSGV